MATWRVKYHDGMMDIIEADSYMPGTGTFRTSGEGVAYLNPAAVKSVILFPQTKREMAQPGSEGAR